METLYSTFDRSIANTMPHEKHNQRIAEIPMRTVGPIHIVSETVEDHCWVPLATFETPLWPSVQRGARLSQITGIQTTLIDERMTRSILVETHTAAETHRIYLDLQQPLAT